MLARFYRPRGKGPLPALLAPEMARDFAAAYARAGGSIALHECEGEPHAFIGRDPNSANAQRALALIADFIHHRTG